MTRPQRVDPPANMNSWKRHQDRGHSSALCVRVSERLPWRQKGLDAPLTFGTPIETRLRRWKPLGHHYAYSTRPRCIHMDTTQHAAMCTAVMSPCREDIEDETSSKGIKNFFLGRADDHHRFKERGPLRRRGGEERQMILVYLQVQKYVQVGGSR